MWKLAQWNNWEWWNYRHQNKVHLIQHTQIKQMHWFTHWLIQYHSVSITIQKLKLYCIVVQSSMYTNCYMYISDHLFLDWIRIIIVEFKSTSINASSYMIFICNATNVDGEI